MPRFADETNFHGLPQLMRLDGKAQKFWTLVLFIALGGLLLQISQLVINFLENEVGTTHTETKQNRMTIPDVIACLPCSFSKEKMKIAGIQDDKAETFSLLLQWLSFPFAFTESAAPIQPVSQTGRFEAFQRKDFYEAMKKNLSATLPEIVSLLSSGCSEAVDYCLDERGRYDCCKDSEIIHMFLSSCIKIKGREQSFEGSRGAMTIVLNVNETDYVPKRYHISMAKAVAATVIDLDNRETEMIPAKQDTLSEMVIEKTQMNSINRKKSPCDEEQVSLPTADCINKCLLEDFYELGSGNNHCGYLGLSKSPEKYCDSAEDRLITDGRYKEVFAGLNFKEYALRAKKVLSACRKTCLYKCKLSTYRIKVSSARLLTHNGQDSRNKNRVILRVYYQSLREQGITQYQKTSENDFIGMLGGLISLWTGGSFVALCHLVVQGLRKR